MASKKQFDVELEESAGRRRAYRVPNPDLSVKVENQPEASVLDLSPLGIGLRGLKDVKPGAEMEVSLNGKGSVSDPLKVRVVRCEGDFAGCEIRQPDRYQTYALHSLVLRYQQKRIPDMRSLGDDVSLN